MGKIYFLLVRIKIKHMELAIIKRESTGTGERVCWVWLGIGWHLLALWCLLGPNTYNENDTIAKYEIMDGAPVRGQMFVSEVQVLDYS